MSTQQTMSTQQKGTPMNIRPWLAGGACAAAVTLVAASGAAASTTAVHHAAARTAAARTAGGRTAEPGPAGGKVIGKGLHQVKNVPLPSTTLPHLKNASSNILQSSNWSGYVDVALKNVHIRFVSAHLNVPSVNCADSTVGTSGFAANSQWVGLDGLGKVPDGDSTTVEQVGVTGYCQTGSTTPTYYVWYDMYPAEGAAFSGVSPGDELNLSVYYNPGQNEYDLGLTDLNNSSVFLSIPSTCPSGSTCLNSSAEVITQDPGSTTGTDTENLADFGGENFTTGNVTSLDGTKGNLSTSKLWTFLGMEMLGASGDLMAGPSPLEGGQAFSTTWSNPS
jgi:Peptidase A4 family